MTRSLIYKGMETYMKLKYITFVLVTAALSLFGIKALQTPATEEELRGRYHSSGWWSCRLHIDERAIREWSLFSIRNRGRTKFNK